jgi:hypothetical protein
MGGCGLPQAVEAEKKCLKDTTTSRKGAEPQRRAKQIKRLLYAFLGVLASLREIVYSFTADHELALATEMKIGGFVLTETITPVFSLNYP